MDRNSGAPGRRPHDGPDALELLEGLDAIVWEADAETFQFTYVNPRAEQLLGYPVERWMEKDAWQSMVHPDDRAWSFDFCRRETLACRPHSFECRFAGPDGRVVWLRVIVRVEGREGKPAILRGLMVDITQRRHAQEVAAAARERLRLAQHAAGVGLFDWDLGGAVTVSEEIRDLFRLGPDEVPGVTDFKQRVHPDDRSRVEAALAAVIEQGAPLDLELRVVRPDGEVRWLVEKGEVLRDPTGKPFRLIGATMDTTDRKLVQEELRRSSQRLEMIQEAAGLGTWEWDMNTETAEASDQNCRLYGTAPGTRLTFDEWLGYLMPDDRERVRRDFDLAIEGRQPLDTQFRAVWSDGSVHWLIVKGQVLRDENGRPVRMLGITIDDTRHRALEERLRLAQKMEAVGKLAGGVAHDFNNLMTVIAGFAGLIVEKGRADADTAMAVAEIQKAVGRASDLTAQLLAFGRKQVLQPRVLEMKAVVANTEKMLRRLIGEDINLKLELKAGRTAVKADSGQLEQVILNIAVNARDAMPRGGSLMIECEPLEVEADSIPGIPAGSHVRLAVSDSGHGMDEKTKARIFEPFFTTKGLGRGTGLGLATVYGIIEQSGGAIRVESQPGSGSRFEIYLPRVETQVEAVEENRPSAQTEPGQGTILLVEDEAALRDLMARILLGSGYTVLSASGGAEAIQAARRQDGAIDLLLTDVVMPGMSGPEVFERLAGVRTVSNVLYISGYADDVLVDSGRLASGAAFLRKPFSPVALLNAVRGAMAERRSA